jgi:hypothetical protein
MLAAAGCIREGNAGIQAADRLGFGGNGSVLRMPVGVLPISNVRPAIFPHI